jgi:hypothetical protein
METIIAGQNVIVKFYWSRLPSHVDSAPKVDRFDVAFWYSPGKCGIGRAAMETAANRGGAARRSEDSSAQCLGNEPSAGRPYYVPPARISGR